MGIVYVKPSDWRHMEGGELMNTVTIAILMPQENWTLVFCTQYSHNPICFWWKTNYS